MSRRFKRGLVVGKFSPLHRGHELVIRRALAECDEVVVLSYSNPEFPGCVAARREQWLAALFPETTRLVATDERLRAWVQPGAEFNEVPANDLDDTTHRRFCGFLCQEVLGVMVDAVFTSEDYGDGFAAELTRYFRERALRKDSRLEPLERGGGQGRAGILPAQGGAADAVLALTRSPGRQDACPTLRFSGRHTAAPAVVHVLVDRSRSEAPVSGTMLRQEIHAHRSWLSPAVYASFVQRVCLLGGESSGKSTLAETLAAELRTACVPEYGRELWDLKAGALAFVDLLRIAETQIEREEEAARRANRFLFCDTSPLTTLFYSRHLFGKADPALEQLAGRPYDFTILCAADFPFVQDGTRQVESFRALQHEWYLGELSARGIPFLLVSGPVAARVRQVRDFLLSSQALTSERG